MRQIFAILTVLCMSCSTTLSPTQSPDNVVVNVVGARSTPTSLIGATVELLSADGKTLATLTTGIDGAVVFDGTTFGRAVLLLACHEGYFCGALKIAPDMRSGKHLIALAPAMISETRRRIDNDGHEDAAGDIGGWSDAIGR